MTLVVCRPLPWRCCRGDAVLVVRPVRRGHRDRPDAAREPTRPGPRPAGRAADRGAGGGARLDGAADPVPDAVPLRPELDRQHPRQPQPEPLLGRLEPDRRRGRPGRRQCPRRGHRGPSGGPRRTATGCGSSTPAASTTIYAHMNAVTVAVGQTVDQGTQVGTVGNTGNSYGAHLHFEERDASGSVRWPWFDGELVQLRQHAGVAQLRRRPARRQLPARRQGGGGGVPARRAVAVPDPAARAAARRSSASAPRPTSRSSGDWDGDGRTDVGVRTPGTRTFSLRTAAGVTTVVLGKPARPPGRRRLGRRRPLGGRRTPGDVRPVRAPGRRRDHQHGRPRRRRRRAGHRRLGRRRRHRRRASTTRPRPRSRCGWSTRTA